MCDNDQYGELRKNTLIIAVANIGSKAISFILAPLYSYHLSTAQYGTMDLISTTVSLLIPFFCFDIFEATFRYSNDNEYDENRVLSTSLVVCFPGILISFLVVFISALTENNNIYITYVSAFVILGSFISIVSQFARGHKRMGIFAAAGIINSIILLVSNIVFMVLLELKLNGWLLSYLIAQLCTAIFLVFKCKVFSRFRIKYVDKEYLKIFLRFCTPLIPTAAMWWVMNASDRYMIAVFLGASYNGIYAVTNKLPAILSIFENVFFQSWQTTANILIL